MCSFGQVVCSAAAAAVAGTQTAGVVHQAAPCSWQSRGGQCSSKPGSGCGWVLIDEAQHLALTLQHEPLIPVSIPPEQVVEAEGVRPRLVVSKSSIDFDKRIVIRSNQLKVGLLILTRTCFCCCHLTGSIVFWHQTSLTRNNEICLASVLGQSHVLSNLVCRRPTWLMCG